MQCMRQTIQRTTERSKKQTVRMPSRDEEQQPHLRPEGPARSEQSPTYEKLKSVSPTWLPIVFE